MAAKEERPEPEEHLTTSCWKLPKRTTIPSFKFNDTGEYGNRNTEDEIGKAGG